MTEAGGIILTQTEKEVRSRIHFSALTSFDFNNPLWIEMPDPYTCRKSVITQYIRRNNTDQER